MNSGRGSGARALGELAGDVCRGVTEFIVLRLPHSHLQGPSTALKDHSTLFTEREKENTEKRTAWFFFFFLPPFTFVQMTCMALFTASGNNPRSFCQLFFQMDNVLLIYSSRSLFERRFYVFRLSL